VADKVWLLPAIYVSQDKLFEIASVVKPEEIIPEICTENDVSKNETEFSDNTTAIEKCPIITQGTPETPIDVSNAANTEVVEEKEEGKLSSIFNDDIYEEAYGDIVTPHVLKMSKKKKSKNPDDDEKVPKKRNKNIAKNEDSFSKSSIRTSGTINHHFETNGFIITESSKPLAITGVKKITYLIADNCTYTIPLIKEIRKTFCNPANKDNSISFKFDKSDAGFYSDLANAFKNYGLFSKYFINRNILTATISSVPRVINYLTGTWLEIYSSFVLEEIVSDYAKSHNFEYEILTNVKVTNTLSCNQYFHEVDCVISIDDKVFGFEMKSGNFSDYATLYETRKALHFIPDRYLLLSLSLEDDEIADTLNYFYEFYFTGISNFKNSLINMIEKAFA
jgi:hypothetical protein